MPRTPRERDSASAHHVLVEQRSETVEVCEGWDRTGQSRAAGQSVALTSILESFDFLRASILKSLREGSEIFARRRCERRAHL